MQCASEERASKAQQSKLNAHALFCSRMNRVADI
jgi:hypothetical protein